MDYKLLKLSNSQKLKIRSKDCFMQASEVGNTVSLMFFFQVHFPSSFPEGIYFQFLSRSIIFKESKVRFILFMNSLIQSFIQTLKFLPARTCKNLA